MRRLISKAVSLSLIFVLLAADICPARSYAVIRGRRKAEQNQWYGRKVAFLGDSITDKRHVGTTKNYWQYLEEMLGIEPLVYGINGAQWTGVLQQARRLLSEHGQDVDAIMIFAGTNDYNASVPVGEWFFEDECGVEVSGGNIDVRRRRTPVVDESTFCGRINSVMSYLKSNFPRAQIILLTPLHRAYAVFGTDNVQPDESYSNAMGYFLDEYVETVRKASDIWSVPVIDLYSDSGLYPLCKEHAIYFHSEKTDMLHPAAAGHCRIAKTLMYAMQALPSGFRDDD